MSKIPKHIREELEGTEQGKEALKRLEEQIAKRPNAKFTIKRKVSVQKTGTADELLEKALNDSPLKAKRKKLVNSNENCEDC